MVTKEYSQQELRCKAERYCVQAERCCSEVKQKLLQLGADEKLAEAIIAQLAESNFINERRYAEAFVKDKLRYQGWGRRKIEMMLRQKQVDSQAVSSALEDIDGDEYRSVLKKVADSKRKEIRGTSVQDKARMYRFLLQRGFLYDEIKEILV